MKHLPKLIGVGFILATTVSVAEEVVLDTADKKFSYAIGSKIGEQLSTRFGAQPDVDIQLLLKGLNAVVSGEDMLLSEAEIDEAIAAKQRAEQEKAEQQAQAKAEQGRAFLAENATRDGVKTTDSGLQYFVVTAGDPDGVSPERTDTVVVHYQGTLMDGTVFDSSYTRGEPATFSLQSIIPGWQEVLQLMRPGDKWAIVLPPELGYGARGAGSAIGPNEVLLFDIELLEVRRSGG